MILTKYILISNTFTFHRLEFSFPIKYELIITDFHVKFDMFETTLVFTTRKTFMISLMGDLGIESDEMAKIKMFTVQTHSPSISVFLQFSGAEDPSE